MARGSRRAGLRLAALEALKAGDDEVPRSPSAERHEDGWVVRALAGAAALKDYRCPGCDHPVTVGTPHTVAWPAGSPDDRRHWHTPCWQARHRRRPRGG